MENFLGKKCSYRGAATAYNTTSLAEIRKTVIDMRANGAAAELQVDAQANAGQLALPETPQTLSPGTQTRLAHKWCSQQRHTNPKMSLRAIKADPAWTILMRCHASHQRGIGASLRKHARTVGGTLASTLSLGLYTGS